MADGKGSRKGIGGRPATVINWRQVDAMASLFLQRKDISNVLGVSDDCLDKRCKADHGISLAEYLDKKRSNGKLTILRAQFEAAKKGNPAMLIWMGKQVLNQRDKKDLEVNGGSNPLKLAYTLEDETDENED